MVTPGGDVCSEDQDAGQCDGLCVCVCVICRSVCVNGVCVDL